MQVIDYLTILKNESIISNTKHLIFACMYRYFLELGYKGTHYSGWQIQINALTVQQKINEVLAIICNQVIETTGCGRTDTGVHASLFFLHFDSATPIEDQPKFIYQLNSLLPTDIAIYHIYAVNEQAHARFDATIRSYRYFISFRKNPFLNETTLFWRSIPDIDLMNKAAAMFLSHTDYTSFSKTGGQHTTNLCTIFSAQWIMIDEHLLEYRVSANRFLRGMVRAMVGTMMMVGHKKITLPEFEQILLHGNRSDAGESVPPQGLFLSEVQYPYIPQKKLSTNLIPFIL